MKYSKFDVGDVVIIKKDLSRKHNYEGIGINDRMILYKGCFATIVETGHSQHLGHFERGYRLDIDDGRFFWVDKYLEKEKHEITERKGVKL